MAHSQHKLYRIFQGEVESPYEYARTLSNGEKIGVIYTSEHPDFVDELSLDNEEIVEYIDANHTSEQ